MFSERIQAKVLGAAIHLSFNSNSQLKKNLSWENFNGKRCDSLQQGISAEDPHFKAKKSLVEELRFQNPKEFITERLQDNVVE